MERKGCGGQARGGLGGAGGISVAPHAEPEVLELLQSTTARCSGVLHSSLSFPEASACKAHLVYPTSCTER